MQPSAHQIQAIAAFFLPHCTDQTTLRLLIDLAADPRRHAEAYALFQAIRLKTLHALKVNDGRRSHQYHFEEICAKTLYNLSGVSEPVPRGVPAPFDEDAPAYVLPLAEAFRLYLGLQQPPCIAALLDENA